MADNINNIDENKVTPEVQESVSAEQAAVQDAKSYVMKEKDVESVSKKQIAMKILVQSGLYIFLIVMAFIVLFPFYWMLMSSVKTIEEYRATVPTLWPHQFRFETYKIAVEEVQFGRIFLNTCFVGIVSTILSLIITVLTAYAFARFNFKGKTRCLRLCLQR